MSDFIEEKNRLLISVPKYHLRIPAGEKYTSSFQIRRDDEKKIEGIVTSDSHRILIAENEFRGVQCGITFGVDTKGLRAGDRIDGNVVIISSVEEASVPIHVQITEENSAAGAFPVKDLDAFARLCRESMREGFHLFRNEAFPSVLCGKDAKWRALYRGMSHNPVTYHHLEEFLVAAGRKEPLTFSADRESFAFWNVRMPRSETLHITKNTWGYDNLQVSADADFIRLPRKNISTEDFIGKVFDLDFVIDSEKLGAFRRRGKIILQGMRQRIEIEVTAYWYGEEDGIPDTFLEHNISHLMRGLLNVDLGRADRSGWIAEAESCLAAAYAGREKDPDCILRKAALSCMKQDYAEAIQNLWPIHDNHVRLRNEKQKACYLVLAKEADLLPEEERDILPALRRASARYPSSWLLLRLCRREEGETNLPEQRLQEDEDCYDHGCCSPFLYLDAWRLLEKDETLLRRLSDFMLQVLAFAQRTHLLTDRVLRRAAFLSGNRKRFSASLYRLLVRGYEQTPSDELLEAICRLIIRGNPSDGRYHIWYARAVRRDLHITKIYEYYMDTFPGGPSDEIPLSVLMYFSHNNTLGEVRKAALYANIIQRRKKEPELFRMFLPQMREFAADMLQKGAVSEELAPLYREFYSRPQSGREAALLGSVLFRCRLSLRDTGIKKVIVCYENVCGEMTYPVSEGCAFPDIYHDGACILFEDRYQRRYQSGVEFRLHRFLNPEEFADCFCAFHIRQTGTLLFCCGGMHQHSAVTAENVMMFRMAAEYEAFTGSYRNVLRRALLEYYLEHPSDGGIADFVRNMDLKEYAETDKRGTVTLLIQEGQYDRAFDVVSEYGYEDIAVGILLRLASRMILRKDFAYDEELLVLTCYIYRAGKYDDVMLSYLSDFYDGPVRSLCDLRRKLKGFQMDTYTIDEKILKQSVFADAFPDPEDEILREYVRMQGNRRVLQAYFSHTARGYLLGGHDTPDPVFENMSSFYRKGVPLSIDCRIALLKYESRKQTWDSEERETIRHLLREMREHEIRFGFFQSLPPDLTDPYQVQDKVFIEHYFRPGSRVMLSWRMKDRNGNFGPWVRSRMTDRYRGVYEKDLLLFFGETLIWYISVEEGNTWRDLEQHQTTGRAPETGGKSRFHLLNRMLKQEADGNRKGMRETMEQYLRQDAFVSEFFHLM